MKILSKNKVIILVTCFCTSTSLILAQEEAPPSAEAIQKTLLDATAQKQTMSYGLGFQNGEQFASYGFIADDLDKKAYIKGLIDALMKKEFGKDPIAYDQAMKAYDRIVTMRERALAATNEEAQKAFMEKNGKRKEVVTTKSGLQYEILKEGKGKQYTAPAEAINGIDTTAEFHLKCKGTLLDGTLFMETPDDEPMPFDFQVIPGLAEALKIMPTGSRWKIFVPASLGFGDLRQGPKISPKSMLIYEVELTDIKTKKAQTHQHLIPR